MGFRRGFEAVQPGSQVDIGAPEARQSTAANSASGAAVTFDTATATADIPPQAQPEPPPQPAQDRRGTFPRTRTDPAVTLDGHHGGPGAHPRTPRLDGRGRCGRRRRDSRQRGQTAAGIDLEEARDEVTNLGFANLLGDPRAGASSAS